MDYLWKEFGPPQAGNGYDRWVIGSGQRHTTLHVVVNAPARPDRAHVLIFDPAMVDGHAAIDIQVNNSAELSALMMQIKRMAAGLPPPA